MTVMNRVFGLAALLGFSLSLIVHLCALSGIDVVARVPAVWLLHLGIFVVFFPFVISMRKTLGPKPSFAHIRAAFPPWIVMLGCALLAYTVVNFILFMAATEGGNPSIEHGKYVLMSHGRLIRELTLPEYTHFWANQARGFSGHWLAFYFIPAAYFLFRR